MKETKKSFCRVCQAFCGYEVDVEDDKIIRLRGDRSDPASQGYACFKGLRHQEFYSDSNRLLRSLKKCNGTLVEEDSETVLAEAGLHLRKIIDQHGQNAVGIFSGTQTAFNTLSNVFIGSLAAGLQTPWAYNTMTIDQSAKWIAAARMGDWQAGPLPFEQADVWMLVGNNPMTSMVVGAGSAQFAFSQPLENMRRTKARGMKLIVIDPRRTETAERADLHLQILPGRDTELAASLLHVILREDWIDQEFCNQYVDGLPDLEQAVEPFSPENIAPIVGVSVEQITEAAAIFARDNRRGMVGTGTGPDMSRFSNTSEHLYQAINVVCGRFPRAGENVVNPSILHPQANITADVIPPHREWEQSVKTTVNSLGTIRGTAMSAEISNEILHEGEGGLRAMIVVGGNLHTALPDQIKAEKALSKLDLLIVIDPVMSGTAQFADYVIAPKLQYERADSTFFLESFFQTPFAHVTGPVVPPPEGSDVVDEWYALWRIADAAGVSLNVAGEVLDREHLPSSEELLRKLAINSNVPYDQVVAAGQGAYFAVGEALIGARETDTRFQLLPEDVADELHQVHKQLSCQALAISPVSSAKNNEFQAVVRRHKDMMNSTGTYYPSVVKRYKANPIYMNPSDMERLSLKAGDEVIVRRDEIREIGGLITADDSLREGLVAISHGWSGRKSHPGEASNRLIEQETGKASINHMPIMSGYTVTVHQSS